MAAQNEAKQLDSVTDFVEEAQVDSSKALEAVNVLTTKAADRGALEDMSIKLDKAVVQQLMDEFEVTQGAAESALRRNGGDLKAASRYMIYSYKFTTAEYRPSA